MSALVALAVPVGEIASQARSRSNMRSISNAAAWTKATADRVTLSAADAQSAAVAGFLPRDTRSVLNIDRPLRYGEYEWNDRAVPAGQVVVAVDLRSQMISVFRAGHEIGTAVILYGADDHETPIGTYPVRSKDRVHQSVAYDALMPFTLWLTPDGVAIHGSDVRGGHATHGCIGVPIKFAELLFRVVQVGDPVVVVRSLPPGSRAANG